MQFQEAQCPCQFENVRYGLELYGENLQILLLLKSNISIIQMQILRNVFKVTQRITTIRETKVWL